jgi:hypothetical protein
VCSNEGEERIMMDIKTALTPKEVIVFYPALTTSEGTLANWRNQKRGPKFYKVSRKIVYRPEDIEAFIFQNPVLTIDSIETERHHAK